MKIKSNSSTGYELEVDLEYPKTYIMNIMNIHQHQKHLTYKKEWLSDYCLEFANELQGQLKNQYQI